MEIPPCDEASIEMQIFRQVFHSVFDDFPMASNHCRRFLIAAALRRTMISLYDKLVQLAETYEASDIFNYFETCTYPRVPCDTSYYLVNDNSYASTICTKMLNCNLNNRERRT